jgi:Tfp pilus assembly protein PilF
MRFELGGLERSQYLSREVRWVCCVITFVAAGALASQDPSSAYVQTRPEAPSLIKRAQNEFLQAKYEQAARDFRSACQVDPQNARAFLGLGLSLASMGKLAEGQVALKRAVDLAPANVQMLLALAKVEIDLGNYTKARLRLLQAGKLQPKNPQVGLLSVEAYLTQKQHEQAMREIRSVSIQFADNAAVHSQLGLFLLQAGAYYEAKAEFELSRQLNPSSADAGLV